MSRIPPAVATEVIDRAGGFCEACGWPQMGKMDLHHRKLRSQGGQHTVANLVWLHHECHMNIHANPSRSYGLGHMVRSRMEPSEIPVQVMRALRGLRR